MIILRRDYTTKCHALLKLKYSLFHSISFFNLNLVGLFSTERDKRDLEN